MKTKSTAHSSARFRFSRLGCALMILLAAIASQAAPTPLGTEFTYQGRFNDNGVPASGIYDLRFTIYDAAAGGAVIGVPVTQSATTVSNGLFTVTLDFGSEAFTGQARWLEIGARTNGSISPHTALDPRQPVTSAPYATYAGTVGAVSWNSISGVPLNIMSNMLGSVGNQPLELKVNGQRALRLEPTTNTPNLIGGFGGNFVSNGVVGATIGGGGAPGLSNVVGGDFGAVGGGLANAALGAQSVVAGGGHNVAGGRSAFIGGGGGFDASGGGPYPNVASGDWSVIGGGWLNQASGYSSTIGGGALNQTGSNALFAATGGGAGNANLGYAAVIAGGYYNRAENNSATVGGGGFNFASGFNTTVAGGAYNTNLSPYATIAGGQANLVEPGADLSAIGGGWLNWIQSGADQSVIAGGNAGQIQGGARESFIGGGFANNIQSNAYNAFIGGGAYNSIPPGGTDAFIGGGILNTNASGYSTIGGGYRNGIGTNSPDSTVGGGAVNSIESGAGNGTIGGGIGNRIGNNSPYSTIAGGFGNSVSVPAQAGAIGGGLGNAVAGEFATVSGGRWNTSSWIYATVGGGYQNFASGNFNGFGDSATVAGGYQNTALGNNAFVGGGFANYARGDNSTIAGGWLHTNLTGFGTIGGGQQNLLEPFARFSVIAGGDNNRVRSNSTYTVISGGQSNQIGTNASYAIIAGGFSNEVTAPHGFAAGRRAKANHAGAFVWADSKDTNFNSTASNQFNVRATGGVRLETGGAGVIVDGLGVLAGSVSASQIADGAVTTAKIADGTIVNLDISASAAIADTKLATISTAGKVANSALSSSVSLLRQTIESAEITDGTIAPADLDLTAFNQTFWRTTGNAGTTPTANFIGTTDNQPLAVKVNGATALRIDPTISTPNIVGGLAAFRPTVVGNNVRGAVVAGGNAPAGPVNGFGGGDFHAVFDSDGAIGGGFGNKVGTDNGNPDDAPFATVAGGVFNGAAGYAATVAGGDGNVADGLRSSVGGGAANRASGTHSTISGGLNNLAAGATSFAAGNQAKAMHHGSFVWADSHDVDFFSTASNQFLIRASGGVGIGTAAPGQLLQVGDQNLATGSQGMMRFGSHSATAAYSRSWDIGVPKSDTDISGKNYSFVIDDPQLGTAPEFMIRWDTGYVGIGTTNPASALHVIGTVTATAFNPPSDRNLKENFAPVSPREVLDKVAAMPISRWNFIGDAATPHVGPMAQDFHAAFGLGTDERHIATVDADGVALAAIQGLNQKLTEELKRRDKENAELKSRLSVLEQLVAKLTEKGN